MVALIKQLLQVMFRDFLVHSPLLQEPDTLNPQVRLMSLFVLWFCYSRICALFKVLSGTLEWFLYQVEFPVEVTPPPYFYGVSS